MRRRRGPCPDSNRQAFAAERIRCASSRSTPSPPSKIATRSCRSTLRRWRPPVSALRELANGGPRSDCNANQRTNRRLGQPRSRWAGRRAIPHCSTRTALRGEPSHIDIKAVRSFARRGHELTMRPTPADSHTMRTHLLLSTSRRRKTPANAARRRESTHPGDPHLGRTTSRCRRAPNGRTLMIDFSKRLEAMVSVDEVCTAASDSFEDQLAICPWRGRSVRRVRALKVQRCRWTRPVASRIPRTAASTTYRTRAPEKVGRFRRAAVKGGGCARRALGLTTASSTPDSD
jgi:hypothetical protein